MKNFGDCRHFGQNGAAIQARMGHSPASDSNSRFQPRLNHAMPSGSCEFLRRQLSSVLAALLLVASGAAPATTASGATTPATINARSPSFADVSTAINSANDGDTVVIPAGTATWTSTLIITKGITLIGQTTTDSVAGTAVDKTIIQDNVTRTGGGCPVIKVNSVSGKTYRISGFTFAPLNTKQNQNGMIYLQGKSHAVRIDHCHFPIMTSQSVLIGIWAAIWGVADHNIFECLRIQSFNINMADWPNPDGSAGVWGDGSWATPTELGSEKFFFIEDNYFKNVTGTPGHGAYDSQGGNLDGRLGERFVFRHNHCYETQIQDHGTETGRLRGCRVREIYNNDFHYAFSVHYGGSRSGVTITHDNTFDGGRYPPQGITFVAHRAYFKETGVWAGASGDDGWDVNDTRNGPFTENGFSYNPVNGLYENGTATSGSITTIVDSTKNWKPNQWVNFTAKRVSDAQIGYIQSNTANTLTVMYAQYPTSPVWAAGNQYQIRRPLILLDQPGRGQGDLMTGTTPIKKWPNNALEPSYSWNDIYKPTGAHVNFSVNASNVTTQKVGRDFYNNTPMPGYKVYTYPHPLVSGLAPPSNLRITP